MGNIHKVKTDKQKSETHQRRERLLIFVLTVGVFLVLCASGKEKM